MSVREYDDQNGQRRYAVDVQADSIGHDMSRGISTYSKLPARTELTADEYEQKLAATVRDPLPGDVSRAEPGGAEDADAASELVTGDTAELDLAGEVADEEDDEPDGNMPASAYHSLDPTGGPA
jgi:hypothetical protein